MVNLLHEANRSSKELSRFYKINVIQVYLLIGMDNVLSKSGSYRQSCKEWFELIINYRFIK